jgi:hypothetical protein
MAKAGRRMPLKQIPDLEIPAHFAIPTCDRCDAEILGDAELVTLDSVMKSAYAQALSSKSEQSIRDLQGEVHQRELERLIGVSAGYVSKLKHAQAEPGGPITALLMLLADEPRLIERLRELWAMKRSSFEVLRIPEQHFKVDVDFSSALVGMVANWANSHVELAYGALIKGLEPDSVLAHGPGPEVATNEPMALVG